jgi:hypothetical protein
MTPRATKPAEAFEKVWPGNFPDWTFSRIDREEVP